MKQNAIQDVYNFSGLTAVVTGVVVPIDGGFSAFSGV